MWDWDAEQQPAKPAPPKKKVSTTTRVVFGVILVLLLVAPLRIVRFLRDDPAAAVLTGPAVGQADTATEQRQQDEEMEKAFGALLDQPLRVANPDGLSMTTGETMVLRNRDNEASVTPGALAVRIDPCSSAPIVTVALTAGGVRGSVLVDPGDYRLRGADGTDAGLLSECVSGFGGGPFELATGEKITGELAFVSAQPRWLVYAPDGGAAQALWRLA